MAGAAFTVRYVPVGTIKGTVGDYIDEMMPGDVVVLDNNGRTDCTVWGDILTVTAKGKGIAGTVIDGVFRDLPRILDERYPIFSRGRFMMTGKDRVMVESTQVMVSIGSVQVKPGDILVGDDSGVVVVPQEMSAKVLEVAGTIEEAESRIVEAVQNGLSLGDARRKFGYHSLQSRKTNRGVSRECEQSCISRPEFLGVLRCADRVWGGSMAEQQVLATRSLARYVAETRYESLPKDVLREAKRRTADVVSIALSGFTSSTGKGIQSFAQEISLQGGASLWGSGIKVAAEIAALSNATMAYHLELDDVHRTSHSHPGISVVPVALALCEEKKLSPKDFLAAVVVGYDVITRVGIAVSPSIYVDRVFLAPGTLSPLGGAATAANLYGLDEEEAAKVLGAAAFLSPFALFEAFAGGAPIKNTAMGWGGLVGIWAVKLCAQGLFGPPTGIEGDFGYAKATADHYDLDKINDPANVNRGILNTGIKPYSCCRQHHSAVDAILELREKEGLRPENVERILVRTFAVASRGSHKKPHTVASATYSAPFSLASALATGSCWREQYTPEKIADPYLLNLADKVDVVKDDELDALYDEKWPAIVEVTTKDGHRLSARRDVMKGEPEYPISDEDLKAKFTSLATDAVSATRAEEIWQTIMNLEHAGSIMELDGVAPCIARTISHSPRVRPTG